jgi:hypothetical protein
VGVGVGNARASRAELRWRSAVVIISWDSGGSSRWCNVGSAESANGCGEAIIDQVSVAVVWLLHKQSVMIPFRDHRKTYAVGVTPGVRQPHNGSQNDKTLHVD